MIKHVGTHNDKKVIVMFREVPGEDHMALVLYTEKLPTIIHDDIMRVLQREEGQAADHFAEALHRFTGTDGVNLLERVHRERWMKKVRAQDVILRPVPGQKGALLSEVNEIIRMQKEGSEAARRMAELDANTGMADYAKNNAFQETQSAALTDADIAKDLIQQAEKMMAQINTLNAEVTRLTEEAYGLDPSLKPKKTTKAKKAPTEATA